jgi:REP element-mobilizing transposase RayT
MSGGFGPLVLYYLPRLLPLRRVLSASEFTTLAQVIDERRSDHGFLLSAWVFLPDHWHAIFYPRHPLTVSRVMESIKDGATKRINRSRQEAGRLRQPRFFDRALRTVREYHDASTTFTGTRFGRVWRSARKVGNGRACMITWEPSPLQPASRMGCRSTECRCPPMSARGFDAQRIIIRGVA